MSFLSSAQRLHHRNHFQHLLRVLMSDEIPGGHDGWVLGSSTSFWVTWPPSFLGLTLREESLPRASHQVCPRPQEPPGQMLLLAPLMVKLIKPRIFSLSPPSWFYSKGVTWPRTPRGSLLIRISAGLPCSPPECCVQHTALVSFVPTQSSLSTSAIMRPEL